MNYDQSYALVFFTTSLSVLAIFVIIEMLKNSPEMNNIGIIDEESHTHSYSMRQFFITIWNKISDKSW